MSKIRILFQPNNSDHFEEMKEIVELIKSVEHQSDYEYEITAINYSFDRTNKERASYSHQVVTIGTIHYLFDDSPTNSNLSDHKILNSFAKGFKTTLVNTLEHSEFKAYVSEENLNSSFLTLARDMVEGNENEKIRDWETLESITQYKNNNNSTKTFFPKENDYTVKSSANPSKFHYKPFALLCGGVVTGLFNSSVFFGTS
ncbi:MAG: hypothetical protein H0U73_04755 [Tatlockia sp.]|nr:hypothetical protein [Tatlockia sp.]